MNMIQDMINFLHLYSNKQRIFPRCSLMCNKDENYNVKIVTLVVLSGGAPDFIAHINLCYKWKYKSFTKQMKYFCNKDET